MLFYKLNIEILIAVCGIWIFGRVAPRGVVKKNYTPMSSKYEKPNPLCTKDLWETMYVVAGTQFLTEI